MWFKKGTKSGRNVYMLLDKSGSMESSWKETLEAINGYVKELENDVNVYLACFDQHATPYSTTTYPLNNVVDNTVLRESTAGNWKNITNDEVMPRGGTPLYDAAGKTMDKMLADNPEKAVLVVMTDGYENASREYTLDAIKSKLKRLEEKNWPTVFLGADFSKVTSYVSSTFGINAANIVNTTAKTRGLAMNMHAAKTSSYMAGDNSAMAWTDEEKKKVEDVQ